jgi:23S rRNA (adenine2503-C2)-methyltransferase
MKETIFSQSLEQLSKKFNPSFRAKQIFEWLYQKKITSFDQMTNLSLDLRNTLKEEFCFFSLTLKEELISQDGETHKYLFQTQDGLFVESVLIISDTRFTVCVSSQVGCNAKCAFCASGKNGLKRNLKAHEILEQVLFIDRNLHQEGKRVSHIVFMGMGEPLENFEEVHLAQQLIQDPLILGISKRRITLSTVGVIDGIKKLIDAGSGINLVLSLHAPNQALREKIIPYAKKNPLPELLKLTDEYFMATKRNVTYEYILIKGFNDSSECAEELVNLLKDKQCSINLIPYNPISGSTLKKPDRETIEMWDNYLNQFIPTTRRYTKGDDIAAACGQLAGEAHV